MSSSQRAFVACSPFQVPATLRELYILDVQKVFPRIGSNSTANISLITIAPGTPPRLILAEQLGCRSSTGRTRVSNKPPLYRWARSVQAHLRIHKPVAVVPAEHPAPSGAPAEHNTETSTSSSLQLTVFWPLTIRRPALPAEPAGPGGPWSPFGPVGPGGP